MPAPQDGHGVVISTRREGLLIIETGFADFKGLHDATAYGTSPLHIGPAPGAGSRSAVMAAAWQRTFQANLKVNYIFLG